MQPPVIMNLLNENERLISQYAELMTTNAHLRHTRPIPLIDPDDKEFDPMDPLCHKSWKSEVMPGSDDDQFRLFRKNVRLREEIAKLTAENQALSDLELQDDKIIGVDIPQPPVRR